MGPKGARPCRDSLLRPSMKASRCTDLSPTPDTRTRARASPGVVRPPSPCLPGSASWPLVSDPEDLRTLAADAAAAPRSVPPLLKAVASAHRDLSLGVPPPSGCGLGGWRGREGRLPLEWASCPFKSSPWGDLAADYPGLRDCGLLQLLDS